jgi:hypothetical protein
MSNNSLRNFCISVSLVLALAIVISPALLRATPVAAAVLASGPVAGPAVLGNWEGALSAGGGSYRLLIHLTQDKDGALTGTMDSLDQGANGIPLTNISYKEPKVHFEIGGPSPGLYDGSFDKAKDAISGNWQQAGQDFPLDFKRAK